MNRINSPTRAKIWGWRRWISAARQDAWIARLQAVGCLTWTLTERPNRVRILLAVYQADKAEASALQRQFGGQVSVVKDSTWIPSKPTPPTRIGGKLEIIHEKTTAKKSKAVPSLYIPHGLAFGSGEHGTTYMLLRALTDRGDWRGTSVLDLGTGSGVLALAARYFGADTIVATDFDSEAVRTARQNEALNFRAPLVRWLCADVKKLKSTKRYDLVLANLFSGILCEASSQIAGSVKPGGQLWLSGVLRTQEKEVSAAYRREKLKLIKAMSRGKWVMLQWSKPDPINKVGR